MKFEIDKSVQDRNYRILATVSDIEMMGTTAIETITRGVIDAAVKDISERFVEENYGTIVAGLNMHAINNLILLEVAKGVKEKLNVE
jgi:hypothetical protein